MLVLSFIECVEEEDVGNMLLAGVEEAALAVVDETIVNGLDDAASGIMRMHAACDNDSCDLLHLAKATIRMPMCSERQKKVSKKWKENQRIRRKQTFAAFFSD